jgi:hypothetical protein
MTRTIYNWSELLEEYRGKSAKKRNKLKKWSDMDNPEESSNKTRSNREGLNNKSVFIQEVDVGKPEELGYIKNRGVDLELGDSADIAATKHKIALLQLLYDTMGQDTETIPAMYSTNKDTPSKKYSEKENLMIDLLELNLRKRNE